MTAAPTGALAGAVELLDRSLAYTRAALAEVRPHHLGAATPCAEWTLEALLHHMDDGLDAFTEAATGRVALVPTAAQPRLESIRAKACALLGWWCEHPVPETVEVGPVPMPSGILVGTAALEIAVHGWDVHQAIGSDRPVPAALARHLLPVAHLVVATQDRPGRFAEPLPVGGDADPATALLAHLGRG